MFVTYILPQPVCQGINAKRPFVTVFTIPWALTGQWYLMPWKWARVALRVTTVDWSHSKPACSSQYMTLFCPNFHACAANAYCSLKPGKVWLSCDDDLMNLHKILLPQRVKTRQLHTEWLCIRMTAGDSQWPCQYICSYYSFCFTSARIPEFNLQSSINSIALLPLIFFINWLCSWIQSTDHQIKTRFLL